MDEILKRPPEPLGRRPAGDRFERVVERRDGAHRRERKNDVGCALEKQAVTLLARAQRLGLRQEFRVLLLQLGHQPLVVFLEHLDFPQRIGARRGVGLGADLVQRGDEGFDGDGLGQVFVRAHVEGQLLIARRGVGGRVDDDGQVMQARVLADFVAETVAVHPRHEDVGDDCVHALTLQQSERVHAVMGIEDRVAFAFEPARGAASGWSGRRQR